MNLKNALPNDITIFDYVMYIFILLVCFLFFQTGDLFHTSSSSYAYLNGHILDFYDYNQPLVARNDYFPLIYIIFAVWNIPLKLFGLMHDVERYGIGLGIAELVWAKLLIVLFFFATSYIIFLLAKMISWNNLKAKKTAVIFSTSPIAIFAAFIFGQYDIIGVFFTMVGLLYFLRKDLFRFSFFFSLAISVKFFPLIVFIPLLLLVEKRIIYLIKFGLISFSTIFIQSVLYFHNDAFRKNILRLAGGKMTDLVMFQLSELNTFPVFIFLYLLICFYAYAKEVIDSYNIMKTAVFISLITYSTMFATVSWHPQWLILLIPFFALSSLYINDLYKYYLLDFMGMFGFIYITVNTWPNHVDAAMLYNGVFHSFFPYIPIMNMALFIPKLNYYFMGIFFLYLFSPPLFLLFQGRSSPSLVSDKTEWNYFRWRFVAGLAVFIIPTVFCVLAPKSIARKLDPRAFTLIESTSSPGNPSLTLFLDNSVKLRQSFIATKDGLMGISLRISSDSKSPKGELIASISDEQKKILAVLTIKGSSIKNRKFNEILFPIIENSKDKTYYLDISSDFRPSDNVTVWKSATESYLSGELYNNFTKETGDLSMEMIYDR